MCFIPLSDYESFYDTRDGFYDSSSQSNSELCEDESINKFNEAIELGHKKLIDKSTSKTFYILGFDLFDDSMQIEIEKSYLELITLLKSGIEFLITVFLLTFHENNIQSLYQTTLDKWTLKMIISTQKTPPKLYSNINTIVTTGRFSLKIRPDICQLSHPKPITPAKVSKSGKCLSQPKLIILVDVNGYNGRAKLQLIGAIAQLVVPFPNHRISIHFGGMVTPEPLTINLDNVDSEEVLDRVIRMFESLNGYNQSPIKTFYDEIVDLHLENIIMSDDVNDDSSLMSPLHANYSLHHICSI